MAEDEKVYFGLVDKLDPLRALEQLLTLDSDDDGTPDYRDPAPFDPTISSLSRAPGDLGIRVASGLRSISYLRDRHSPTQWGTSVLDAIRRDEGFSFRDKVGDGPSGGYMVSVNKHTETRIPINQLTAADVADYMSVHQQELAEPDQYMGGWLHKGYIYLDVSKNVRDLDEAMRLARQHSQLAIFDLSTMDTVMVQ